jgi:hypothetical protein
MQNPPTAASARAEHEAPPAVPLNHCYRVLDSATYRAIEESGFLRREFAVVETRTTVRADRTYTGLYLYGAHTYFEFFDVARGTMGEPGHSGLAFGVDEPGGLQRVEAQLGPESPMETVTITRQLGDRQVPWFLSMAPASAPSSALSLWFMEYHPEFLAGWRPEAGDGETGIRRDQVLRRYAATLPHAPPHPSLQDVVGLTIALDLPARRFLAGLCRLLGYQSRADGESTLLEGPDFALRLVPETASARGIREMALRVRRAPIATTLPFGPRSLLSFPGDGTALWSF